MKVLHVLELSPPDTSGYSVRSQSLIEAQLRNGIDAVALTSTLFPRSSVKSEIVGGVRYLRSQPGLIMKLTGRNRISRFVNSGLELAWNLRRAIKQERPDIIHFHSFYSVWPIHIRLARYWSGAPVVYEVRSFPHMSGVAANRNRDGSIWSRSLHRIVRSSAMATDEVVTISNAMVNELQRWGIPSERLSVVPNGVNYDEFARNRNQAPPEALRAQLAGCFVIGYIGSIQVWERLEIALEAMRLINDSSVKMLVVGDGPALPALRETATRLGLDDRVVFTGHVPRETVAGYYTLLDLLCLCRAWDTLTDVVPPLKPFEAMASGVIVVAGDTPALRESLADGRAGILYQAGDPEALAKVITDAKADPGALRSLIDAADEFVRTERNWIHLAARYKDLYASLRNSRKQF